MAVNVYNTSVTTDNLSRWVDLYRQVPTKYKHNLKASVEFLFILLKESSILLYYIFTLTACKGAWKEGWYKKFKLLTLISQNRQKWLNIASVDMRCWPGSMIVWMLSCQRLRKCVLELPTVSSWICSSQVRSSSSSLTSSLILQDQSVWRKSNLAQILNMNLYKILKFYKILSRKWMLTRFNILLL